MVLNNLYKHSQLQTTFGVNMLALVNNRPEVPTLKRILEAFVEHRARSGRAAYGVRSTKAEERAHILEGLKIALDNLDAVIALIRRSQSPDVARGLDAAVPVIEIQANAILEMRLQRLHQLERDKLVEEYRSAKTIEYLRRSSAARRWCARSSAMN